AKPDGGTIHEDELAGNGDRPLALQRLVDAERFPAPVLGRSDAVRDGPDAVVDQRAVDEAGPYVQRLDEVAVELLEAPNLIGVDDAGLVALEKPMIEVDDAAHERGLEDTDAAIVEKVDAARLAAFGEDRVVAEMRVAMDDPGLGIGLPPGGEHR